MRLTYTIKFVADMDRAIAFFRDTLSLTLKFQSPGWSEFATGDTILALHPASEKNPAGSTVLGFASDDLAAFYAARGESGVTFINPPTAQHGAMIAAFLDSEGGECRVSG